MVLPVADQRAEHVRTAQERRIGRRGTTNDEVIAAAGADGAAVDQEFLGGQTRQTRFLVDGQRGFAQLLP